MLYQGFCSCKHLHAFAPMLAVACEATLAAFFVGVSQASILPAQAKRDGASCIVSSSGGNATCWHMEPLCCLQVGFRDLDSLRMLRMCKGLHNGHQFISAPI